MTESTSPFRNFDGMCWPVPGERLDEVEWTLRYQHRDSPLAMKDRLLAASVVAAYCSLISASSHIRDDIIRELRKGPENLYVEPDIPRNCWLDDEYPCPSPCVFDDPSERISDCCKAVKLQADGKSKTECDYYRAAPPTPEPEGIDAADISWPAPKTIKSMGMFAEGNYYAFDNSEPERPTDKELVKTAMKAVKNYRYATELPYFLSEESSEYEPFVLILRTVLDRWGSTSTNRSI